MTRLVGEVPLALAEDPCVHGEGQRGRVGGIDHKHRRSPSNVLPFDVAQRRIRSRGMSEVRHIESNGILRDREGVDLKASAPSTTRSRSGTP